MQKRACWCTHCTDWLSLGDCEEFQHPAGLWIDHNAALSLDSLQIASTFKLRLHIDLSRKEGYMIRHISQP